MENYKEMYFKLFNKITDAIEILKQAQIETEEIFINSDEDEEKGDKIIKFPEN